MIFVRLEKFCLLVLTSFMLFLPLKFTSANDQWVSAAFEARDHYTENKSTETIMPLFEMHVDGNTVADGVLGDLFYSGEVEKSLVKNFFEYETNEDAAYFFYLSSADELGENAYQRSVYILGRNFFGNEKSKYYDIGKATQYLAALAELNHAESQFYLAVLVLSNKNEFKDPEWAENYSFQMLEKAAENGVLEAHFLIYQSMVDNIENVSEVDTQKLLYHLKSAADNKVQFQAEAAIRYALHYQNGVGVERDVAKFLQYAKKAAELGNANGHYFYGKYVLMGVDGDPDYELARHHLIQAKILGHKNADKQLEKLEKQLSLENSLDDFQPELEEIMTMFGAAQSYSNTSISGYSGDWEHDLYAQSDQNEQSFTRDGDSLRGNNGQTWRLTGNTIRNISTGEYYRFSGNQITGSRGDRWKIKRNQIQSLDNPSISYKMGRNGIRGSNGSYCSFRVNTMRCY